jgi:hypothetical protein
VKVLRHKLFTPTKTQFWDKFAEDEKRLLFVMGAADKTTIPNTHLVTLEHRYRPGGYGWDTISPRQAFNGGVRDSEDAAFRIDVPNGHYKIRCQFRTDDNSPHRIAIYINDKRTGKPFVVPADSAETEQSWETIVDNGTLILVIHSLDKGENAHWVWSSCAIERYQ